MPAEGVGDEEADEEGEEAEEEEGEGDGEVDAEGGEEGDDAKDDEREFYAVGEEALGAFATLPFAHGDGFKVDMVACFGKGERAGCGPGELVGKEVDEFEDDGAVHGAEAGGEIFHVHAHEVAAKAVEQAVADPAA